MPAGFPKNTVNGLLFHPVPISTVVTDCETETPKAKKNTIDSTIHSLLSLSQTPTTTILHKKTKTATKNSARMHSIEGNSKHLYK